MASEIELHCTNNYSHIQQANQHDQPSTSTMPLNTSPPFSPSPPCAINANHYSMLIGNTDELCALNNLTSLVECDTNNTMLHLAASFSQIEFIDCIIQKCPQLLTRQNSMGDLPIHVAAKACRYEAVEKLVFRANEHQISMLLEMVNKEKNTALHIALENQQEEMAKLLFESYPKSFYMLNEQGGFSPLYLAIKAEFWELVRDMLSEDIIVGCPEALDSLLEEKGRSVVHAAIVAKRKDILQMMLTTTRYAGLIYEKTDELGRRPLSYAADIGFLDGVKSIFDAKKFQNEVFKMDNDEYGSFPIHSACKGGNMEVVKLFFSSLPENTRLLRNKRGQNILHVAAESGKANIVKFILGHPQLETMINMKDEDGNTPLHLGAIGKHPRVVDVLAWNKRVKLGLQNKIGQTALDIAEDYEDQVPSFEERLTWLSLKNAGVPTAPRLRSVQIDVIGPASIAMVQDQQGLINPMKIYPRKKRKNKYKERINTLILVATLVATVTFASGFSVPGGYNNNKPHEGLATLAHKVAFQVFVITDTISMYSAILSLVALIWAHLDDPRLVLVSLNFALPLLGTSLAMMAIAFTAAMYVVLHTIVFWLGVLVLIMGGMFLAALIIFFTPLYSPTFCIRHSILRYLCHVPFMVMLLACEKGKRGYRK